MAYYGTHKLICVGYYNGKRVLGVYNMIGIEHYVPEFTATLAGMGALSLADLGDKPLSELN